MKSGIIFSIEEFAIHDGPGIRTTIFLKGCPLSCTWCHNPEGISPHPQYLIKKTGKSLCGEKMTTAELSDLILKNKLIYTRNKGGITLTGGEPCLQSDFVIELLEMLPDIHKAIETSGYVSTSVFQKIVSLTDLVLFDIKQMDNIIHKKYTGKDNRLILNNLEYLCKGNKDFIVRIPLIPGVNDSLENMLLILNFIKNATHLKRVELMRYHKTAGAKYSMIEQEYKPLFDTTQTPQIHNVFEEHNIKTLIL